MKVGSLFSGIGGLDLGLERAGMTVRWNSEIDPYCCRVLAKHWPGIPNLGDVTTVDWSTVEPVDLICGGYPCQPFSTLGQRRGADDPRHLWPYVRDAIAHLRPCYVLLENVAAHLRLGFDSVLADLAALGFDADWSVVSACSVGAPHLRRRLFCVAYPRREGRWEDTGGPLGDEGAHEGRAQAQDHVVDGDGEAPRRPEWAAEPAVGRMADGVPARVDRLRALGNAVVPQVAELVGRRVMEMA